LSRRFDTEIVLLLFFSLASGVFLALTFSYPSTAALFPKIIAFITLFFSLYYLAGRLRKGRGKGDKKEEGALPWHISAISMLVFLGLIYLAGLIPAMVLYIGFTIHILGYRNPVRAAVIAVFSTAVLASAMKWFFVIPIPMGLLFS